MLMARRRFSQADTARRAGMSKTTLSRRLQGDSEFTVGELYRLADVFDVPARELLALLAPKKVSA